METSVYEDKAKKIIAEIKEILDVKGINLDFSNDNSIISKESAERIFSGSVIPTLAEFLTLCELSGIAFKLPSIETPDNPM